jgi:hypothetical protein
MGRQGVLTNLVNVEYDRANPAVVESGAGFQGRFRDQIVSLGMVLPVQLLGQIN